MRTYAIINILDLLNVDFTQLIETSEDTIRKSLDGTQFVIKYNTEPSFITNGTVVPLQTLTHSEALILMQTSDWTEQILE
jgi:hypothetical protein|tara:strand:- start:25 stop:264 length:240 start_codon:yes stop_codon:yes gene_type:complete